ncbi:MAG: cysteine desulfurase [Omnitrophica WOR_2 bacterium RIFCSPHIGHO2_02_FULL_68_15]|nr:MAG: cysteine desulfurase [Omnitrophica WOR_2 bacterium RIFCSPHIGHO2_02_FULL_68_15]
MDARAIRRDFPILERMVHGKPLIYLDNAATSHKPTAVLNALDDYYRRYNSNIHRGIHLLSEEATAAYEGARETVARFLSAPAPETLVFTRNTTEAINLVAQGWGRRHVKAGDEILLTEMEHHSNLVPWQMLAQQAGATLRFIPVTDQGLLDLTTLPALLTERTRMVAVTMMSNVLGTIPPVGTIIQAAHARGAVVLLDGAQAVPHLPVNVRGLDCDFLAFSAHKMLGPTGVGVLYGKPEHLEAMDPVFGGGDMIREVWLDHSTWNEAPWKFEAGTPNIADVIAFGAAVDYLSALGMANVQQHEQSLTAYALKVLGAMEDLVIYGPRDAALRGGVVAFNVGGLHPHDLGQLLDAEGIAVRAGHHCCQPLMRTLGVAGTARASFYIYNHPDEVDALARALVNAKEVLNGVPHR